MPEQEDSTISLHSVDKDSINRSNPKPNTHDTITDSIGRMTHGTSSLQYQPPGVPVSAYIQTKNSQILTFDGTTKRLLINPTQILISAPGVDVTTADPTVPGQIIFNSDQDILKVANVVTGSYTVTTTDVSNTYALFSFPHGLTFIPTVVGSFLNTTDGLSRQLPWFQTGASTRFGTNGGSTNSFPYSSDVLISSIDSTNINIILHMYDIFGLSYFLSTSVLNFKFLCIQETIVH